MYCTRCGVQVLHSIKICPKCGNREFNAQPASPGRSNGNPGVMASPQILASSAPAPGASAPNPTYRYCNSCNRKLLVTVKICPCGSQSFRSESTAATTRPSLLRQLVDACTTGGLPQPKTPPGVTPAQSGMFAPATSAAKQTFHYCDNCNRKLLVTIKICACGNRSFRSERLTKSGTLPNFLTPLIDAMRRSIAVLTPSSKTAPGGQPIQARGNPAPATAAAKQAYHHCNYCNRKLLATIKICPCGSRSFRNEPTATATIWPRFIMPWIDVLRRWTVVVLPWPKTAPGAHPVQAGGGANFMSRPRALGGFERAGLYIVAITCLVMGLLLIMDSHHQSTYRFIAFYPYAHSEPETIVSKYNGANFASGLALIFAGLLALNRGSKRQNQDEGVIDRRVAWAGLLRSPVIPVLLMAITGIWFGYRLLVQTKIHWTPTDAAAVFRNDVAYRIYVTGGMMYGVSIDGTTTHVAHLTPALMRAIYRSGLNPALSGETSANAEYPLPGVLPLLALIVIAVAVYWQSKQPARAPPTPALTVLTAFGLMNLYVVWWLVSAQEGVLDGDEKTSWVNPDWGTSTVLLLVPALCTLAAMRRKILQTTLRRAVRVGWLGSYFLAALAPLAWSYRYSNATPGSPALLWILLYLACAGLCWFLLVRWDWEAKAP
jgi:hypothetical protein